MPAIMKLTDVGSADNEVEPYLSNPDFILQQKFDGTRIQVQYRPITGEVLFSNNGVDPCSHSAARQHYAKLEAELTPVFDCYIRPVVFEGELLIRTGEFIVWDVLVDDYPEKWGTTEERLAEVEELFGSGEFSPHHRFELVKVSPTARTEEEKRALWARIVESNVEGAVSKRRDSSYQPGVRSKDWLKHKLVKTADVVVTSASRTFKPGGTVVHKGSASLAFTAADGSLKSIASASLIGKDLTIAEGDVVEVAFLYRESGGGGLVQPRIIRKRWDAATGDGDKTPAECTEDQFAEYSRVVV